MNLNSLDKVMIFSLVMLAQGYHPLKGWYPFYSGMMLELGRAVLKDMEALEVGL